MDVPRDIPRSVGIRRTFIESIGIMLLISLAGLRIVLQLLTMGLGLMALRKRRKQE